MSTGEVTEVVLETGLGLFRWRFRFLFWEDRKLLGVDHWLWPGTGWILSGQFRLRRSKSLWSGGLPPKSRVEVTQLKHLAKVGWGSETVQLFLQIRFKLTECWTLTELSEQTIHSRKPVEWFTETDLKTTVWSSRDFWTSSPSYGSNPQNSGSYTSHNAMSPVGLCLQAWQSSCRASEQLGHYANHK